MSGKSKNTIVNESKNNESKIESKENLEYNKKTKKNWKDWKVIENEADFFEFICLIQRTDEKLIFRGEQNFDWELESTLIRTKRNYKEKEEFRNRISNIYKELFDNIVKKENAKQNLEVLSELQHSNALPTPLIDFTQNILHAFWFAFDNVKIPKEDGSIYIIEYSDQKIENEIDFEGTDFNNERKIYLCHKTGRAIAQKSYFIFDCNYWQDKKTYTKISIKKDVIIKIKEFLNKKDINSFSIFPDLKGIMLDSINNSTIISGITLKEDLEDAIEKYELFGSIYMDKNKDYIKTLENNIKRFENSDDIFYWKCFLKYNYHFENLNINEDKVKLLKNFINEKESEKEKYVFRYFLGLIEKKHKKFDESRKEFNHAYVSSGHSDIYSQFEIALIEYRKGNYSKSLECISELEKLPKYKTELDNIKKGLPFHLNQYSLFYGLMTKEDISLFLNYKNFQDSDIFNRRNFILKKSITNNSIINDTRLLESLNCLKLNKKDDALKKLESLITDRYFDFSYRRHFYNKFKQQNSHSNNINRKNKLDNFIEKILYLSNMFYFSKESNLSFLIEELSKFNKKNEKKVKKLKSKRNPKLELN